MCVKINDLEKQINDYLRLGRDLSIEQDPEVKSCMWDKAEKMKRDIMRVAREHGFPAGGIQSLVSDEFGIAGKTGEITRICDIIGGQRQEI